MRKRALSVLLAAAMSVSLMACGSSSSGTATTAAAGDAAAETTAAEAGDTAAEEEQAEAKPASDIKVGMVTDIGGVNDG